MQCLEQRRDEQLGGQSEAAQGADLGDAVGVLHSGRPGVSQAYDESNRSSPCGHSIPSREGVCLAERGSKLMRGMGRGTLRETESRET